MNSGCTVIAIVKYKCSFSVDYCLHCLLMAPIVEKPNCLLLVDEPLKVFILQQSAIPMIRTITTHLTQSRDWGGSHIDS